MSRPRWILLLVVAAALLLGSGCANSPNDVGYYRRGTIHTDSYPPDYYYRHGPGYYRYGRPTMY